MPSGTVDINTGDGVMPVYDVRPDGHPRGAVIVVQEAFGVNDHIRDVTRRAAAAGYHAVAPHLFYRSGDPELSYDDIPAVLPHMEALTTAGLRADLDASLGHLAAAGHNHDRTAIIGFCLGGGVTLLAATWYRLAAAVTFYGGGVGKARFGFPALVDVAPAIQSPWLGLFGDQDAGIPVEEVEALRGAAKMAPVDSEIVRYADAGHGFHCDQRGSYHEPSARDAWTRTLAWIDQRIPG